jgi:hypothetical protein
VNLDFVPSDLEFVPFGLDFVPKNLDFVPGNFESFVAPAPALRPFFGANSRTG